MRVLVLVLGIVLVTSCSREAPPCEENPPFYLKGTAHDCAVRPKGSGPG